MNPLKRALFLVAICLLIGRISFAQYVKNPAQEKVATDFMLHLTNNQIDPAIKMIGLPSKNQKADVIDAADQIAQLRGRAELSIEPVVSGKATIFKARYLIRSEQYQDFFRVDIVFPNSKTNKISIVTFHHRAEFLPTPPPPPPAPPHHH